MPDPVWCPGEIPRNEWLVRRELTKYPRSWRERHGEELVTTTIEVLDADGFGLSSTRACDVTSAGGSGGLP